MKKIILFALLSFSIPLFSQEFESLYITENVVSNNTFDYEFISIERKGSTFLVTLFRPSISGAKSYSIYCLGTLEDDEIILDNSYSIYALKPQPDGTLHYYAIKDDNEFPGKDFRPITEEDLRKIAELK